MYVLECANRFSFSFCFEIVICVNFSLISVAIHWALYDPAARRVAWYYIIIYFSLITYIKTKCVVERKKNQYNFKSIVGLLFIQIFTYSNILFYFFCGYLNRTR